MQKQTYSRIRIRILWKVHWCMAQSTRSDEDRESMNVMWKKKKDQTAKLAMKIKFVWLCVYESKNVWFTRFYNNVHRQRHTV